MYHHTNHTGGQAKSRCESYGGNPTQGVSHTGGKPSQGVSHVQRFERVVPHIKYEVLQAVDSKGPELDVHRRLLR